MSRMSIRIKPSHAGMLRADLGVAAKNSIPMSKLMEAKHSKDPAVRRRATFAVNARGWNHKGK